MTKKRAVKQEWDVDVWKEQYRFSQMENTQLRKTLQALFNDCFTRGFTEMWSSYRNAELLLSLGQTKGTPS